MCIRDRCEAERLRPGKSEVERLLGDASKLRALTGWQPAYTFEQGLAPVSYTHLDVYKRQHQCTPMSAQNLSKLKCGRKGGLKGWSRGGFL